MRYMSVLCLSLLCVTAISLPSKAENSGQAVVAPVGKEAVLADGTKILVDGTIVYPDGTKRLPNGNVVLIDGTVLKPQ
jgi:hypothetical protein